MNRIRAITYLLMIFALATTAVVAQEEEGIAIERPFVPRNPIVMSQGGSFTANAEGYPSFFTNPAGFAGDNELTIVSANPWLYSTMDLLNWLSDPENELIAAATGANAMGMATGRATAQALTPEQESLVQAYIDDAGIDIQVSEVDFSTITLPPEVTAITNAGEGATAEDVIVLLAEGTLEIDQAALEAEYPDTDFASFTTEELDGFKNELISRYAGDVVVQVAEQSMELPPGFVQAGVSAGLGATVGGFGIGAFAQVEATTWGETVLSTSGSIRAAGTGVVGYAHTLALGRMNLHIGADVRPMVAFKMPVAASEIIGDVIAGEMIGPEYLLSAPGFISTALGFDLGAILELGPLSLGMSVRDFLNTTHQWYPTNLELLAESQALPEGQPAFETVTPMTINVGASFHPDFGRLSVLLDPRFHADIRNIAFVPEYYENINLLDVVNLGAEITVLKMLSARAGFGGGYLTGGIGVKLLFLEANIAAMVDATSIDEVSDFGVSAEVALRF